MPFPPPDDHVPSISVEEVHEIDRLMMKDFGVDASRMLENAGRGLAMVARDRFLGGDVRNKRVFVLAGRGANGAGVLVAARRLHAWGARVTISLTDPPSEYGDLAGEQLKILLQMGVLEVDEPQGDAHLILDGLIGISLSGAPRDRAAHLIRAANEHPARVLSLDGPSGLDLGEGTVHDPCIRATATCTLALPKDGLFARDALDYVGELYLADLGVPPQLYLASTLELQVPPVFSRSDVLRLR